MQGKNIVNGPIPISPDGEPIMGPVPSLDNFFAALQASGFAAADVVFVDIAFADLSDLDAVNAVFAARFPTKARPARSIYEAAALPFGGKVKVMGTAVRQR